MRILLLLGLLTYWLTHPAAMAVLVHVADVAFAVLAHATGNHATAQSARGIVTALSGSHWN